MAEAGWKRVGTTETSFVRNEDVTSTTSIVIGTYGDREWYERGRELSLDLNRSLTQQPREVIVCYADDLATARNEGARSATGDRLVFLDADDYLDEQFIEAMDSAVVRAFGEKYYNTIFRPSVRGFNEDGYIDDAPVMGDRYSLLERNWLPIGCSVPKKMFTEVGGFDPQYPVLEDWALWLACLTQGAAIFLDVPSAVYLINDDHSRNNNKEANRVASDIRKRFRGAFA